MTKSQLVEILAKAMGISNKKADEVVRVFFEEIEKALLRGERVEIRGFGSFKVKDYGAYQGRNPKTGEIIQVPPKRLPVFKVGSALKKLVDTG